MIKVLYVIVTIVIVIGSAVSSIPYFTMDTIETIIVKKQKELSVHGIDVKVVSNTGYFNSKREITVNFTDKEKVLQYFEKSFQIDTTLLTAITQDKNLFEQISLKGVLINKNTLPHKIESFLSIDNVPTDLYKKIVENFINSLSVQLNFNIFGELNYIKLNNTVISNKSISDSIKISFVNNVLIIDEKIIK